MVSDLSAAHLLVAARMNTQTNATNASQHVTMTSAITGSGVAQPGGDGQGLASPKASGSVDS